jgi:4-amino-4-deoxy-L-arabinose transferase-like glycosyltransferase
MRTAVQIGADEGFELTKATLCLRGHKLYTEIWNDQPPLHTFLITQILKHVSPSVLGPRLLTSAFSVVLLCSVFLLVERYSSSRIAFVSALFLVASPGFLELTASCMLEVPALAPALAGICLVARAGRTKWMVGDLLAGALFGFALQIKLINLVWTPLVVLIVLLQGAALVANGRSPMTTFASLMDVFRRKELYFRLAGFGCALVLTWIGIDLAIDGGAYATHFHQSWKSHFGGVITDEYGSPADHLFKWSLLARNWDTTVFAVVGVVLGGFRLRKDVRLLLPLCWIIWSLVVFSTHKPWWPYYYVHLAIPICWCGALGALEILNRLKALSQKRLTRSSQFPRYVTLTCVYIFIATSVLWMGARVGLQIASAQRLPRIYSSLVIAEAERYKPFCEWLYTDDIVLSFHTGIPIPPNLAVIPLKRLWSGDMSMDLIAQEVEQYKPGLVLLNERTLAAPFEDLLNREYRAVYQDSTHRLYARISVIEAAEHTWAERK